MALFVPRIGEKHMDASQALIGQHVRHHFHRIVTHHAQIGELVLINQFQQIAHARRMHINGNKVFLRQDLGYVRRGRAHAKANFKHFVIVAAKHRVQIDVFGLVFNAPLGQTFGHRRFLRITHVTLTQNIAAYAALVTDFVVDIGGLVLLILILFAHSVTAKNSKTDIIQP